MKNIIKYILPVATVVTIASCDNSPKSPGYEYMPEMYDAIGYEPNSANPNFADSITNRQPVAGTIARANEIYSAIDRMPYQYEDSPEGYEAAGSNLRNPLERNDANMKEGKRLYADFCTHCHGDKGMGDGLVVTRNGPKPPAFSSDALKDLPEGKAFHSVHFGRNFMGSHASQLTASQRWQIIMYIQTLQKPEGQTAAGDSTGTEVKKG